MSGAVQAGLAFAAIGAVMIGMIAIPPDDWKVKRRRILICVFWYGTLALLSWFVLSQGTPV